MKALPVDYPAWPGSSSFLAQCDSKFINFMENLWRFLGHCESGCPQAYLYPSSPPSSKYFFPQQLRDFSTSTNCFDQDNSTLHLAKTNYTLYTLFLVLHQSQPRRRPSQDTQSSAKHQISLLNNQSIHQYQHHQK